MAITTQDIVKGLDLTGQNPINASHLNQLVDVARLGNDKGMIIATTDTALDTPEVPDPDGTYNDGGDDIFPIWWKRYIWWRVHFTGEETVTLYKWNEELASDPTLLKWEDLQEDASAALAAAQAAQTDALDAISAASVAGGKADTALADAASALSTANTAQATAIAVQTQLTALALSLLRTGIILPFVGTTIFSTTEDEGLLECDGSEIAKSVFPNLYAVIGETYGSSAPGVTFKVPDLQGRGLFGAGDGAGLTVRSLGQSGGAERVTLTSAQSGIVAHAHQLAIEGSGDVIPSLPGYLEVIDGTPAKNNGNVTTGVSTRDVAAADASTSHENMPPFGIARWLIKT